MLTGCQGVDLGLLLADHVEETVLRQSAHFVSRSMFNLLETYHLPLLLVLQLLMQLTQTRSTLVARAVWPWASATGRWASLHLTWCRHSWVIEIEVHANAGPAACAFDVPPHATGGSSALVFVMDTSIHRCSGSKRVR